jgi:RHS repeat-associated protein
MSPATKVLRRALPLFAGLLAGLAAVAPAQAQNAAAYVSHVTPAVMQPGQSYPVSVTFQNTGTSTWTAATNYKLGSINPTSNTRWGLNRVVVPHDVLPSENVTFNFTVTAPTTQGMHDFQWQMLREGVQWIPAAMPNFKLAVGSGINSAEFVSQSVTTSMAANQAYPVSVTMKNNGSSTWTPGDYYLRSQNPQDNLNWGVNRVDLTSPVAPGESFTFNFSVTPPVNGNLYFQWQMAVNGVNIGALTPSVTVAVSGTNAVAFVSQSVPSQMEAGQSYPASITLQNTGTTTWRPANGYKLAAVNPTNNTNWGFNRVELPNDVPPGQQVTVNFNVTAPATYGTYNFQWHLRRESVPTQWINPATPNVAVAVGSTNAAFASQNVPANMVQGFSYPASVTMQNTGTFTWNPGEHYLRSQNPQDNSNWGLNRVELPNAVSPGQSVTFSFDVMSSVAGTIDFQWGMASAAGNFGQASTNVPVAVAVPVNNAAFVSQMAPTSMVPGQTTPVTVTMQNNGTSVWRAANGFKLASQNPPDNTTWGLTRVPLPADVWPGDSATFSFNITAPTTAGTYNFQWQMIEEGVQPFGTLTANVAVNVQAAQSGSLYFIHADHLSTPRLVADAAGATVWRWDQQEPFGGNWANENPGGAGIFDMPLRFPGQYFDKETTLHYNYFRDYGPSVGRYKESDPIGLRGGLNTYAYAEANPLVLTDPRGLISRNRERPGEASGRERPADGMPPRESNPQNSPGQNNSALVRKYECFVNCRNTMKDACLTAMAICSGAVIVFAETGLIAGAGAVVCIGGGLLMYSTFDDYCRVSCGLPAVYAH